MALPPEAPGQWCSVRVTASGVQWWAQLQMTDRARGQIVRQVFLGPLRRGARATLLHIPAEAGAMTLLFIGGCVTSPRVKVRVLHRAVTALRLLAGGLPSLAAALRGDRLGLTGRLRTILGQAPGRRGEAPPYAIWLALYEDISYEAAPAAHIQVAIVADSGTGLAASLASAPADSIVISCAGDWKKLTAPRILLLGAGEVLAPHALSRFADACRNAPDASFICADTDSLDVSGERYSPLFKPEPGPVFLSCGLATTGACLFRHDASWPALPLNANATRLTLAERCAPASMLRIPAILTHLPCVPMAKQIGAPRTSGGNQPKVAIIIPSSCRSPHVLRSLKSIVQRTDYQNLEILLVLTSIDPDDRAQAAILAEAARLPDVRIIDLGLLEFNFSQVNNAAAEHASSNFLLFMNDDVTPVRSDWLACMMPHASTPGVGAVGARLLYGNGMVQHAGVIMGLAGLCEHADRLMRADDPGNHGRAFADREVSAVTAACMLVSAALFRKVSGFDEAFAIALNDVDLCLRIRATGASIVYAAGAVMYHYESLSLGRHYRGVRASLEAIEVRRLRDRWHSVIADDPCYNPQASLEPGREWQPAYPPRLSFTKHKNFADTTTKS